MFDRAFVATSVALGSTLEDALTAVGHEEDAPPETLRLVSSPGVGELIAGLRAPTRPARASALAMALTEVLAAVDEGKLR